MNNNKKNIVFVHGFTNGSHFFNEFFTTLEDEFNYFPINIPGFDENYNDFSKDKFNFFLEECIKQINELHLNDFYLVSHYIGSQFAIPIANKLEKKIQGMLLISPINSSFRIVNPFIKNFLMPKKFKASLKANKYFFRNLTNIFNDNNELEKLINDYWFFVKNKRSFLKFFIRTTYSKKNLKNLRSEEKNITVNTLVVCGKYDLFSSKFALYKTFKKKQPRPNIQMEIMKNSSHFPFIEERSNFIEIFNDFTY